MSDGKEMPEVWLIGLVMSVCIGALGGQEAVVWVGIPGFPLAQGNVGYKCVREQEVKGGDEGWRWMRRELMMRRARG